MNSRFSTDWKMLEFWKKQRKEWIWLTPPRIFNPHNPCYFSSSTVLALLLVMSSPCKSLHTRCREKVIFTVAITIEVSKFLEWRTPVVEIAEILTLITASTGLYGTKTATLAACTLLVKCLDALVTWWKVVVGITKTVCNKVSDVWVVARWTGIACTLIKWRLRPCNTAELIHSNVLVDMKTKKHKQLIIKIQW